jgi:hypothetical protein
MPGFGMSWPSGERMVTLHAPPGRKSNSTLGVVHGRGAKHFGISVGSVQQR